ncbi:hypothetical protein Rrhod_1603 [Rhodococcus rhodnii LMG 5362]|uniref:Uncharacterized protein n=1 Tax=Rhodococcus rhodnii LMG 5362 TaxID=1273125 RepID=R7WSL3_9NOCA|nr:hypothetical protein Rrhod_1603 [Rhodococcus rhodnii LMG 5362]
MRCITSIERRGAVTPQREFCDPTDRHFLCVALGPPSRVFIGSRYRSDSRRGVVGAPVPGAC